MTIKELWDKKTELGYTCEQLEEKTGIPKRVIQAIFDEDKELVYKILLWELEFVLNSETVVKDVAVTWGGKKQGEYTLDDYYALPDEERVELIDGVLYNMAAPSSIHQVIAGKIYTKLDNYVMEKKGTCIPAISPIDVQLDCDDKTMVQPDVIIVCDRDKFRKKVVYGAPDFVVEVLSPSTSKKDTSLKLSKYHNAGVREYWVVDPMKECVIAYRMNGYGYYSASIYSFEDEVPVRIFQDECKINFKEIKEYIAFLYEK